MALFYKMDVFYQMALFYKMVLLGGVGAVLVFVRCCMLYVVCCCYTWPMSLEDASATHYYIGINMAYKKPAN